MPYEYGIYSTLPARIHIEHSASTPGHKPS
jgi:hypothetical protein